MGDKLTFHSFDTWIVVWKMDYFVLKIDVLCFAKRKKEEDFYL